MLFLINPFIFATGGGGGGGSDVAELVRVYLSGDKTTQNFTSADTIDWDAEDVDTNNRHDNATNPDRITFGSGDVGKIVIAAGYLDIADGTNDSGQQMLLLVRHSDSVGTVLRDSMTRLTTLSNQDVAIPLITKVESDGDYLTCSLVYAGDTSITLKGGSSQSSFSVILFDAP